MGDGFIDFESIGRMVNAAGYRGDVEVEIFNAEIWAADGTAVLGTAIRRYAEFVAPSLSS